MVRPVLLRAVAALAVASVFAQPASAKPQALRSSSCPVTRPDRTVPSGAAEGPAAFDHGGAALRVQLHWRGGVLRAGILPDGGSLATIEDDGTISTKLGWWRGAPGRLRIAGRRLDAPAPPLRAHAPSGYGRRGFQPSRLVFPTTGCWSVTGRVGGASLSFVVRVVTLPGQG